MRENKLLSMVDLNEIPVKKLNKMKHKNVDKKLNLYYCS